MNAVVQDNFVRGDPRLKSLSKNRISSSIHFDAQSVPPRPVLAIPTHRQHSLPTESKSHLSDGYSISAVDETTRTLDDATSLIHAQRDIKERNSDLPMDLRPACSHRVIADPSKAIHNFAIWMAFSTYQQCPDHFSSLGTQLHPVTSRPNVHPASSKTLCHPTLQPRPTTLRR